MSALIYKLREYLTLALCLILGLILLNSNENPQVDLLRLKFSSFTSLLATPFRFIPQTVRLYSENKHLRQSVFSLTQENASLRELRAENCRLRNMLNFIQQTEFQALPAQVIGKSAGETFNYIIIDRGISDGLKLGLPVVSAQGLVGQVAVVEDKRALCQIMFDSKFGVAVRDSKNRLDAIVHWDSNDICRLDGILFTQEIYEGDTLITSGIDGVYPKGLYVGKVVRVRRDQSKPFQDIKVKSFTNFYCLEEVFLLFPAIKR